MRPLKFFLLCATTALLAGCAGYHLGPVNGGRAGDKSIEVLPFNSKTLQPRLGEAVTQALREQLQTDGTYRLVTRGGGDIVVTGVIVSYVRDSLSFLPGDVLTAENYHVTITAHVTAREPGTGKVAARQKCERLHARPSRNGSGQRRTPVHAVARGGPGAKHHGTAHGRRVVKMVEFARTGF